MTPRAMTSAWTILLVLSCATVGDAAASIGWRFDRLSVRAAASEEVVTADGVVEFEEKPFVDGSVTFIAGQVEEWKGETIDVTSPIVDAETGNRTVIGTLPAMQESDALRSLQGAVDAWDEGQGAWPQMSLEDRIAAMERVAADLRSRRQQIAHTLMWEICKNEKDAFKEFDRTMDFVTAAIHHLRESTEAAGFATVSTVRAKVRRGPVGVNLMLAPFNYPMNEMYAMLVPSLLMGNTIVMKLPSVGGLVHVLTMEAFAKNLPPGVVNFLSGSGRVTCGAVMKTGLVDMLGFIGGSKAADALIQQHPAVHRLKVFSQLEGKNVGIVLPDADLDLAANQCTVGSTSYNGQRCTAIKLIMVHESVADEFLKRFQASINNLKVGMPWESGVSITPLPEPKKPGFLEELVADSVHKGAAVVNAKDGGGTLVDGALLAPTVVFPVTPDMRLFHEEQFGPVIPIATFRDIAEVKAVIRKSWNGQQAAIFTSDSTGKTTAPLVDFLSTVVGRVNINAQCSRSPDVLPFSGRRSSAMGTMSVSQALENFSVETVVAYPASHQASHEVAEAIESHSNFLKPVTNPRT